MPGDDDARYDDAGYPGRRRRELRPAELSRGETVATRRRSHQRKRRPFVYSGQPDGGDRLERLARGWAEKGLAGQVPTARHTAPRGRNGPGRVPPWVAELLGTLNSAPSGRAVNSAPFAPRIHRRRSRRARRASTATAAPTSACITLCGAGRQPFPPASRSLEKPAGQKVGFGRTSTGPGCRLILLLAAAQETHGGRTRRRSRPVSVRPFPAMLSRLCERGFR